MRELQLTAHERELIIAYRKRAEMRKAVDRILDVEEKPGKIIHFKGVEEHERNHHSKQE